MHVLWCESLWYMIHFSFGSWKDDFYFLQQERPFSLWQEWWGGWVWQWWLTFVLSKFFITFTHPHPAHVIPAISCGRSVLNCYLMESAPENHQSSQMFKAAARPRGTNALSLMLFFCGEESTLGVLLSPPFWAFRLPWTFQLFSEIIRGGLC